MVLPIPFSCVWKLIQEQRILTRLPTQEKKITRLFSSYSFIRDKCVVYRGFWNWLAMFKKGENAAITCKRLLYPNKASILYVADNGTSPAGRSLLVGTCSRNNPTDRSQEYKYFLYDSWYKNTPITPSREDAVIILQAMGKSQ